MKWYQWPIVVFTHVRGTTSYNRYYFATRAGFHQWTPRPSEVVQRIDFSS